MPSTRRASTRRASVVAVVLAVVTIATACDSRDMPDLRTPEIAVISIGRVNGSTSGHIGIDGFMWDYNPCFDHRAPNEQGLPDSHDFDQDPHFGACALPSLGDQAQWHSYTEYIGWSNGTTGGTGIWMGGTGTCRDTSGFWCDPGSTITHGWGRKWTRFALELYPDDPNATGVRLEVGCCPGEWGPFAFTDTIGDITLPTPSTPGTRGLSGSVSGVSGADQVGVDVFQVDEVSSARSSGGVPLYSFASTHNGARGASGSWSVPAVYTGQYVAFVTDKANPRRKVVVRFTVPDRTTIDVNRNAPCFGLTGVYDPATWYLNDQLTAGECAALWT